MSRGTRYREAVSEAGEATRAILERRRRDTREMKSCKSLATFTIGMANTQGRFLKAKNGIAEIAGRKLGDNICQSMKHGKEAAFKEPAKPTGEKLTYG